MDIGGQSREDDDEEIRAERVVLPNPSAEGILREEKWKVGNEELTMVIKSHDGLDQKRWDSTSSQGGS
jgi:hypothetical protein